MVDPQRGEQALRAVAHVLVLAASRLPGRRGVSGLVGDLAWIAAQGPRPRVVIKVALPVAADVACALRADDVDRRG